jgi:hypothetical protein
MTRPVPVQLAQPLKFLIVDDSRAIQASNRADFRRAIPGYGEGRLAFFVLAPP